MRTLVALLIIGLGLAMVAPPVALGHARPVQASPAPDAVVEPPAEVRIWFTQELTLRGNDIVVTDSAGNRVDNGDARVDQSDPDRKQLAATVQPLAPGAYTVTWTSSSAEDGHPATEAYSFSVTGAASEEPPAEPVSGCPKAMGDTV